MPASWQETTEKVRQTNIIHRVYSIQWLSTETIVLFFNSIKTFSIFHLFYSCLLMNPQALS